MWGGEAQRNPGASDGFGGSWESWLGAPSWSGLLTESAERARYLYLLRIMTDV
jgi:hypothetical protein